MNAKKLLAAFCAVIFLNGICAFGVFGQGNTTPQPTEIKPTEIKSPQPAVINGETTTAEQLTPKQRNEKYRIGFQDTIEVQVFRHPELSQVVNVSPDGTILMPRIDRPISAVCQTERELGETISTGAGIPSM